MLSINKKTAEKGKIYSHKFRKKIYICIQSSVYENFLLGKVFRSKYLLWMRNCEICIDLFAVKPYKSIPRRKNIIRFRVEFINGGMKWMRDDSRKSIGLRFFSDYF